MIGFYENFPSAFQHVETLKCSWSNENLQKRIIRVFEDINRKTFSFEETGSPVIPDCDVIFEFGIAEKENFNFLDLAERQRLQETLDKYGFLQFLDWFCAIRYYKTGPAGKKPLRFDYYMLRMSFAEKKETEVQVFHERGPRYISPEDLLTFIKNRINEKSTRKVLK